MPGLQVSPAWRSASTLQKVAHQRGWDRVGTVGANGSTLLDGVRDFHQQPAFTTSRRLAATASTVLPTPFPDNANPSAGAKSSRANVRPTGGRSDPSSTQPSSSVKWDAARSASNSRN